jgi:hypothetical protein
MRPLLKAAFIAQRPVDEDEVCGALSLIAASEPAMAIIESSSDLDDWKFLRPTKV